MHALVAAALLATALSPASSPPADPAGASALEPKSLVVGIDGATFARIRRLDLPHLTALRRDGVTAHSNLYAEPMAPTLSGPGWSSIATGTWPDRHGVRDNAFTGARFDDHPDYLTRLEGAEPSLATLVVATWEPVATTVFGDAVDERVAGGDDASTTQRAVEELADGDPDSTFVHLDDVDHAGHDHGASSPEYADALRAADRRLGRLLRAIESRPAYDRERWLVVVTADHGHTASGGHGGSSPAERGTFVVARGAGDVAARLLEPVDVAPTVIAHHGVSLDPAWDLDGRPARLLRPDAFDRRRVARGWTHRPPSGWRVDRAAMPRGGVEAWRGWSFTTDERWTRTDPGQGRELNVRARSVFAVADPDEWDDASHAPGRFDSTLVTPRYDVAGRDEVALRFVTAYREDGPQAGRLRVRFDGGGWRTVRTYDAEVVGVEQVVVAVPAGARRMTAGFRLTGDNSAFWAVDDVRLLRR